MARFNKRARLDTSQVDDRRGGGGGKVVGGIGGGIGLIILVVSLLLGVNPLDTGAARRPSRPIPVLVYKLKISSKSARLARTQMSGRTVGSSPM